MKKGLVNLNLRYVIEIRDKNGKIVNTVRGQSKSLVKNFAMALRGLMYGSCTSGVDTLKDTSNVTHAYPELTAVNQFVLAVTAPVNNGTYGIQVGVGDQAVNRDDYKLATQCNHGTGVDEFNHGVCTIESVNGTPPASLWRVLRTFTNGSGSTITVKEIGLVMIAQAGTAGNKYYLIARDVLLTPVDVADAQTLTVRYIFTVTA